MKPKHVLFSLSAFLVLIFFFVQNAWARGGGGGSGGGGGGGGGGGFSGGATGGSGGGSPIFILVFIVIVVIIIAYGHYRRKKKIEAAEQLVASAQQLDSAWNSDALTTRVREVFEKFQKDWSDFNVENMKEYLSEEYLKRMVLEMNVLKNEGRKNIMENPVLKSVIIMEATDEVDNSQDRFTAEISAKAHDILFDVINDKQLFSDSNPFTEYWTFIRQGDGWRLDVIRQATEDATKKEPMIAEFATKNGFYYDPDFGWLMMPNKGVIFSKSSFKTSDINNHVVGYFRNKIVEFFTFIPNAEQNNGALQSNYIVAQTVIPKTYRDILVRRKRALFNFGPRGLRRVQTESNDFEGKFCIWADPQDQVSSLELLTPNFMEKVYALPFELNIEVVGNFLYLYAKSRKDIDYEQMLEILSWAFDEMER